MEWILLSAMWYFWVPVYNSCPNLVVIEFKNMNKNKSYIEYLDLTLKGRRLPAAHTHIHKHLHQLATIPVHQPLSTELTPMLYDGTPCRPAERHVASVWRSRRSVCRRPRWRPIPADNRCKSSRGCWDAWRRRMAPCVTRWLPERQSWRS